MGNFINFDLISRPSNWLIIFLVMYLLILLAKVLNDAATNGVSPFSFLAK